MKNILYIVLFLSSGCVEAQNPFFASFEKYLTVELLGQSNAQGARLASELTSDLNGGNITGALCYNQYTDAVEPLSLANNNQGTQQVMPGGVQSFGCEISLMQRLVARYTNLTPVLIKYTLGGTSLVPGASAAGVASPYNWSPSDQLRPDALVNCQKALGKLGVSATDFCIYIQGEQETQSSTYYSVYEPALRVFANHILSTRPNAVLIIVSLSDNQTGLDATGRAAIQTIQQNVAGMVYNAGTGAYTSNSSGIDRVVCIRQNETTVSADGIHYQVASYANIAGYIEKVILKYY
jgi:hypothetical protein